MIILAIARGLAGFRAFSFFACLIGAFFSPFVFAAGKVQLQKNELGESAKAEQELVSWIHNTIDFLEAEGRASEIGKLSDKFVFLTNQELQQRLLKYWVALKDREALFQYFKRLSTAHECPQKFQSKKHFCYFLEKLWTSNLDSTTFFEDSAGKIRNAENALGQKDCLTAANLIKEVEAREGFLRSLVDTQLRIAECLKNPEMTKLVQKKFRETGIFNSEL